MFRNRREVSSVPGGIRVETISDYQAFLDLEAFWNEVAEAPDSTALF